jgi:hypothetical protein
MAKKKAATKKAGLTKRTRSASVKSARQPTQIRPASAPPPATRVYCYRHEIENNPSNASLVVDIPIAEGRGEQPVRPSFVGFTAEMGEEHWPDQFAFRIISLSETTVRVMVSRVDKNSADLSWGVKLAVQVLVVCDAS